MKQISVMLLASLLFISCEGNFDKKSEEVAGVWTIQKVSYYDGKETQTKEGDLRKIVFGATNFGNTEYTRQQGVQIIDGKEFKFELSFSFSSSDVDIMYLREVKKELPKEAIGRAQVYHFNRIKSNQLELFVDAEEDLVTGEIRKDVRYTLSR